MAEMRSISRRRPRFGSPRVYQALRQPGWTVNHKRIERLWQEKRMQVPRKQSKRKRLTLRLSHSEAQVSKSVAQLKQPEAVLEPTRPVGAMVQSSTNCRTTFNS